jgi:predicted AAA+ superfamily ATPase
MGRDDSTINQLRALNVDFAQGFAIGTPLPVADSGAAIMNGAGAVTAHNGPIWTSPADTRRGTARPARATPAPARRAGLERPAWRWRRRTGARLAGGRAPAPARVARICCCIDAQRDEIDRNTRQFLAGAGANNVLLWGSRGTGKSSLIKALFNSYRTTRGCG